MHESKNSFRQLGLIVLTNLNKAIQFPFQNIFQLPKSMKNHFKFTYFLYIAKYLDIKAICTNFLMFYFFSLHILITKFGVTSENE